MYSAFAASGELIQRGGPVMPILALVGIIMFFCIFERLWFFWRLRKQKLVFRAARDNLLVHKKLKKKIRRWIEHAEFSEFRDELYRGLPILKTLTNISCLLGLLGTIVGMIGVFQKIAEVSTPTMAMLSPGIARATIPTMVGMSLSVIGLFAWSRFSSLAQQAERTLEIVR